MQILIDITDPLSPEELDSIIAKIKNQLEAVAHSIEIAGRPNHQSESQNNQGIKKLLDWCDRHLYTSAEYDIPSREERNAR
ncbi:hypothetical protein LQF76_05275 [Gloeomargaritales cyanobacterium VI4D9]|nr:hypothetical protein LQF76_05275 [Gloeomargaritales cyanobacterium VI4D9]